MTTNKIRGLISKGSKFHWTDLHQQEFDHIIENLTKLEHLQPYKQGNTLHTMTDASINGLRFILFQKEEGGKASIIQVGYTCLKNAQIRWHPSELELLAIQYCLKKCHFYTAHSDHPVEILSDCSGLKDFQLQDITNIQNTRLLNIKANLQVYNYTIKHIKGSKNHLADVLSRRPVWLNTYHTIGPYEGLDLEDKDAFAMRVAVSMPHLLRDNPRLRQLEEIARKDKEYSAIIHAIRTGQSNKSLPPGSEGYKMGGEWDKLSIMEEAEVIAISGDDGIDRIFPPKEFRETIITSMHQGGKHFAIVFATCNQYYRCPGMKLEIKKHISDCRTCFKHSPAKSDAQHPGLMIPLSDLSPMDWICCDLCEIKDKKGKKQDYLVIINRYSSVWIPTG